MTSRVQFEVGIVYSVIRRQAVSMKAWALLGAVQGVGQQDNTDIAGWWCPVSPDLALRHLADLRRTRSGETPISALSHSILARDGHSLAGVSLNLVRQRNSLGESNESILDSVAKSIADTEEKP